MTGEHEHIPNEVECPAFPFLWPQYLAAGEEQKHKRNWEQEAAAEEEEQDSTDVAIFSGRRQTHAAHPSSFAAESVESAGLRGSSSSFAL
ncbi:GD10135 [Drosophila simulans]|uniref:GD10135 n=1 Tax=Drosophila simulans TaxID=7240 RepID=B4QG86_DROSI|nr:GD10135 [Drosophila simulans]